MGKGLHLVIPWVLDAPGPVIATSTRPDTLAVTYHARTRSGPVAIFDPQRLAGLPGGLRWSPVRGCEVPRTALVRARGLAAGAGWGSGVSDSDFWAGQTESTLRCLLHAAALDGRRAVDLFSIPMWNHGIPYILKQFIAVVSQPGMVFAFDPVAGYTGLLTGKKAAVIYTSAVYGAGRPPSFGTDFQAAYLDSWLPWTGIDDISIVEFRPNLATADADSDRQRAHANARDAGKTF